jgi:hypothetical protein
MGMVQALPSAVAIRPSFLNSQQVSAPSPPRDGSSNVTWFHKGCGIPFRYAADRYPDVPRFDMGGRPSTRGCVSVALVTTLMFSSGRNRRIAASVPSA